MQNRRFRSSDILILSLGAVLCIGAALALSRGSGTRDSRTGKPLGEFKDIKGKVEVRFEGQPFWKPALKSMSVAQGDRVRTDSSAMATLVWNSGDQLHLDSNSLVIISDPKTKKSFEIEFGRAEQKTKAKVEEDKKIAETNPSLTQPTPAPTPSFQISKANKKIDFTEQDVAQKIQIQKPDSDRIYEMIPGHPLEIAFAWKANRESQFAIDVSQQSDFSKIEKTLNTRKFSESFVFPEGTPSGTYYWRVRDLKDTSKKALSNFRLITSRPPKITEPSSTLNLGPLDLAQNSNVRVQWISDFNAKHQVRVIRGSSESLIETKERATQINLSEQAKTAALGLTLVSVRSESPTGRWTDWSEPVSILTTGTESFKLLLNEQKVVLSPTESGWACPVPLKAKIQQFHPDRKYVVTLAPKKNTSGSENQSDDLSLPVTKSEVEICPPRAGQWTLKATELNPKQGLYRASEPNTLTAEIPTPEINAEKTNFIAEKTLSLEMKTKTPQPIELWGLSHDKSKKLEAKEPWAPQLVTLASDTSWWLRARYIDRSGEPLTDWGEAVTIARLPPPKPTPTPIPIKKSTEPELSWDLKDSGPIYSAGQKQKPWTWLSWSSNPKSDSYELQVSSKQDFSTILRREVSKKTRVMFTFQPGQSLYWRVRGELQGKKSEWSEVRLVETTSLRAPSNSGGGTK